MERIEMLLGSLMQPVAPRQEFVHSLHTKILTNTFPEAVNAEKKTQKNVVMLVLSLMGVTILLGVWIRVVVSLLSAVGRPPISKRGHRKHRMTVIQTAV